MPTIKLANMPQIVQNNAPMSRAMVSTAPSPQSAMVSSYQPRFQWSQPSPSGGIHFAQPKPRAQTNTQVSVWTVRNFELFLCKIKCD